MNQRGKKKKGKKQSKRNEDNLRDLWDNFKYNIQIIVVPEEEHKKRP